MLPSPPDANSPRPKPPTELADLLIMDSLDQKAPPTAADTADLLDSLVEEHLREPAARGALPASPAAAPSAEDLIAPRPPALNDHDSADLLAESTPPDEPADSGGHPQGIELLQREIETLLRGDPGLAAPPPPLSVDTDERSADETDIGAEADPASLSAAEMQTLLPETDTGPVAPTLPAPENASSDGPFRNSAVAELPPAEPEDDAARQLSEAEGVLAAELAQLMAEATPAPQAGAAAVESADSSSLAPATAAVEPDVSAVSTAEETPAAPLQSAALPWDSPGHATTAAAELVAQPPVVVVEAAEAEEAGQTRTVGLFARVRQLITGIALLLAQIVDMPFHWMRELDKNVLGFAALLLLLSGCAMYILSVYFR